MSNVGYQTDITDIRKQAMIDLLMNESFAVVQIAYVYAKNYHKYGEDVTKEWTTVVQQTSVIQKVRQKAQVEAYDSFKKDYEARLKADMVAMLKELQYELYRALCHEIHGKEDCPCTNQTTSCRATFRVCDANRAINKIIQQKINKLKGEEDGKID